MPTYEYLCRQCGNRLEVVQSFSDDPLTTHDSCGGSLRKVFHARGVVFKGSGFYVTDSRQPNPANRNSNGKGSSSKDESQDSKPKAKESKDTSSETPKTPSK
jgi:putative FmdB family regulatory protein